MMKRVASASASLSKNPPPAPAPLASCLLPPHPPAVFSRNVVLNITRKQREWRFYEFMGLRLEDLSRVNAVVSDVRKILRQDARIIQKLHRRVFLDKSRATSAPSTSPSTSRPPTGTPSWQVGRRRRGEWWGWVGK